MNSAQIQGAIRTLLIAAGSWAASVGWIGGGVDLASLAGAVVTIGGLVWSLWSNRTVSLVTQAAEDPAVIQVIASPAIAKEVPSPKVVPLV